MGLRRPGQRRAARHRRRRSRFQTMAQLSREQKLRQSTGRRRSPTQAWRLKRGGADAGPRELLSRDLPTEPARNYGRGGGNFNNQGRPLKVSCRARLSFLACRTEVARHGRRRRALLLRRGAMPPLLMILPIRRAMYCPASLSSSAPKRHQLLLCMGLFSIFFVGSHSDAARLRESCLKAAHASEAFAVAKCRARGDSNSSHHRFVVLGHTSVRSAAQR